MHRIYIRRRREKWFVYIIHLGRKTLTSTFPEVLNQEEFRDAVKYMIFNIECDCVSGVGLHNPVCSLAYPLLLQLPKKDQLFLRGV